MAAILDFIQKNEIFFVLVTTYVFSDQKNASLDTENIFLVGLKVKIHFPKEFFGKLFSPVKYMP